MAAGDITGELVAAVLPDLAINPLNVKRSSDRRFVSGRCVVRAVPVCAPGWAGRCCWAAGWVLTPGPCWGSYVWARAPGHSRTGLCMGNAFPSVPSLSPDLMARSLQPRCCPWCCGHPRGTDRPTALPSAASPPQPVYKADLLPCGPTGPENGEQALPKTRLYSEMVAKAYIRFRDTDLV